MTTLDDTMKNAQKLVDETKDNAGHAASRARSTVLEGVHAVASTITMLRGLGVGDALRWVGLQRRTNLATPFLTFGAGFLAGAAAGVLFAPMAGNDLRRRLAKQAMGLEHDVEKAGADAKEQVTQRVEKASAEVKERVTQKADELAGVAKDALHTTEAQAKETMHKAGDAVAAAGATVNDAFKSVGQADSDTAATNGTKRVDASKTKPFTGGHHQSS
jgi:gas vesicle protein